MGAGFGRREAWSTMMTTIKHSRALCSLLASFFLAWCAAAGWLLWGGDESVNVRFAFALCGVLAVWAGSHSVLPAVPGALAWMARKRVWVWLIVALSLALIGGMFAAVLMQAQEIARASFISSNLKQYALAVLQYAEEHNDILPADMRREALHRLMVAQRKADGYPPPKDNGISFVWCRELGGLRLGDIKHPEKVVAAYTVVAYTATPGRSFSHSVLFLTGRVEHVRTRAELVALLRPRDALLRAAKEAKAARARTQAAKGG